MDTRRLCRTGFMLLPCWMGGLMLSCSIMRCCADDIPMGQEARVAHINSFSLIVERRNSNPNNSHRVKIVYKSPYMWRSDGSFDDMPTVNHALCNHDIAWSYLIIGERMTDIKKWNLAKIRKECGDNPTTYLLVFSRIGLGSGIMLLGNPAHPTWKQTFSFPELASGLKKTKEEKIGKDLTLMYEMTDGGLTFRYWFGERDGIIRREIISDDKEDHRSDVKQLQINPPIDAATFSFKVPKDAKVMDMTDDLIKAIKTTEKQLKVKEGRKKGKKK